MSPRKSESHLGKRAAAALVLLAGVVAAVFAVRAWRQAPPASDGTAASQPSGEAAGADEAATELTKARSDAERKDYRSALDHVDRAIELRPQAVDGYLLKSELLFRLHRSDEMIPWLKRAIQLDPQRFEAHANLAYALRYSGRLDEAEREVRWCLQRRPRFVPAVRIQAEIQRDRGNLKQAADELRRALEIDPHDLDSRLLQANLLLYQRQYEAAYRRLVSLRPSHPRNRRVLAALERAARMTGRPDEAARYRDELTQSGPAN
jgi:tetratricopeptide (TPR) repeat protein